MKAIVTIGVSGSGKSTWAENEVDGVVINRDDTRWKITGKLGWNGDRAYKFHSAVEDQVTLENYKQMEFCASQGLDIIIADTNLNPKTRNKLIRQCEELGYEVEIKEFPISYQEALRRNKEREIFAVDEAVIYKQWEQWCKYLEEKDK